MSNFSKITLLAAIACSTVMMAAEAAYKDYGSHIYSPDAAAYPLATPNVQRMDSAGVQLGTAAYQGKAGGAMETAINYQGNSESGTGDSVSMKWYDPPYHDWPGHHSPNPTTTHPRFTTYPPSTTYLASTLYTTVTETASSTVVETVGCPPVALNPDPQKRNFSVPYPGNDATGTGQQYNGDTDGDTNGEYNDRVGYGGGYEDAPGDDDRSTLTVTVTTISMATQTVVGYPCPTNPAERCNDGYVFENLGFDDISYPGSEQGAPYIRPSSEFSYKQFTFDEGWTLAYCEYIDGEETQACVPETYEGDHYVALYSSTSEVQWRRITYDIADNDKPFQILGFAVSASVQGNPITLITCGWSIEDQYREPPTWCEANNIYETTMLQPISFTNRADLAFIEIGGIVGVFDGNGFSASGKGNAPASFYLDDIAICHPDY